MAIGESRAGVSLMQWSQRCFWNHKLKLWAHFSKNNATLEKTITFSPTPQVLLTSSPDNLVSNPLFASKFCLVPYHPIYPLQYFRLTFRMPVYVSHLSLTFSQQPPTASRTEYTSFRSQAASLTIFGYTPDASDTEPLLFNGHASSHCAFADTVP